MQERIDKYYEIIANNIKTFREKAGMSQEVLAEKASLSREFINRVENHKEKLSLNSLLILAIIFDINPEEFFI